MNEPENTCDQVPYESFPYPQTHPDHLSVVAAFYGLRPRSPDDCRVLELGCAGGGNLIPMAVAFPKSQSLFEKCVRKPNKLKDDPGVDTSDRETLLDILYRTGELVGLSSKSKYVDEWSQF
jgi:hypothetical protein